MRRTVVHTAGLVLLACLVTRCETAIDPFTDDAQRRFAMHGYLDSAADTQFVRIQALRETARATGTAAEGVTVRSTGDLDRTWHDSTAVTATGDTVSVFWSVFPALAGVEYELLAERGGEIGSRARTRVPAVPEIKPSRAEGDVLLFTKELFLRGVGSSVRRIDVWYEVGHDDLDGPVRVSVPYGQPGQQSGPDWRFTVFLTRDRAEVLRRLGLEHFDRTTRLLRTGVYVELFSDEWTGSAPDPGIEVGYGFFASVGRWDVPYTLPAAEVETAGFVDAQTGG